MSDEKIKYATYRGAGHIATVWGVPLIPMLVLCGLMVASLFVFILLLKSLVTALVFSSIIVCIIVWIKIETSIEPRAMSIRVREFKGLIKRIRFKGKIVVTSMKAREGKRLSDVQRYFKNRSRVR